MLHRESDHGCTDRRKYVDVRIRYKAQKVVRVVDRHVGDCVKRREGPVSLLIPDPVDETLVLFTRVKLP